MDHAEPSFMYLNLTKAKKAILHRGIFPENSKNFASQLLAPIPPALFFMPLFEVPMVDWFINHGIHN